MQIFNHELTMHIHNCLVIYDNLKNRINNYARLNYTNNMYILKDDISIIIR